MVLLWFVSGDFNGFDGGVLRRGPKFLIEPDEKYYVVKNKPATITCKALGAVHISFKCANSWIKQRHYTNMMSVDPVTQKQIIETSIVVTKEDVEDYFGSDGYWCECYASDQPAESPGGNIVKSDKRGLVELACTYKNTCFLYCCVLDGDRRRGPLPLSKTPANAFLVFF